MMSNKLSEIDIQQIGYFIRLQNKAKKVGLNIGAAKQYLDVTINIATYAFYSLGELDQFISGYQAAHDEASLNDIKQARG